ncbi:SAM-dependent methyltransferase (plasmid) [Rhodococcus oxybenzonivorans]|uniref:SAM-dependent methyltransferase n=1 Tax=Rhodococcus oxybenzonivorans TaxID=1990687 RepID=A0A2S2C7G2_9NOCA|nr:class I SAM-dependent methyltransferase [Rhodococcus oxybenzonivorans]AWK76774.1 SAM-dependent methyltransferase [Rhodococcus oxybenzonivorans]
MRQPGNAKVEKVFDAMARHYDTQMGFFERFVLGPARGWAVAQARGRVLEIAVGTGLNLPLYGPQVESVIGVDLSEGMLDVARRRIADYRLDRVEVRRGDAQALDVPDASVDTVISTFTYCAIPDPLKASEEALRVLVPGGQMVLAEHGPATNRLGLTLMRAVEPLSVRFGTDHLTRDPRPYLDRAGFVIDTVHRSGMGSIGFRILAHKPA